VAQPTHAMGQAAMRMLLDAIQSRDQNGGTSQKQIVMLKPELRIRNSTAPPLQNKAASGQLVKS
jgi:DNA-binding LacI/PurR family transcriptional regulator